MRQVDVRLVVAAAFTHRERGAGDPDLHTQVAVSNKVQTLGGRWLALDGRVLYKAKVGTSERYNTHSGSKLNWWNGLGCGSRPERAPGPPRRG